MQAHMGTVVVMSCELLVAVYAVTEFAVRPGTKMVSTSKRPDWYWSVVGVESRGKISRLKGCRPAAGGSTIGDASMVISGRKSRGLSVSYGHNSAVDRSPEVMITIPDLRPIPPFEQTSY